MEIHIAAFYLFKHLERPQVRLIEQQLLNWKDKIKGLVLLGREGINGTVSGEAEVIVEFKNEVMNLMGRPIAFKNSSTHHHPFRDFRVKIKREIVTLGRPDILPESGVGTASGHISPSQWHQAMQDPDALILDTRNRYEVDIGKFKSAIDPEIDAFREFPDRIKAMNLPKEKKILMYCTGGIRCEKAIHSMREQGFENVFQLEGGILEYLREFPDQGFEGECFVFDYRVAVDQKLNASEAYKLCPHCGQPAQEKLNCVKCGLETVVCGSCLAAAPHNATCSKNCAHHQAIQSASKRPHLQELLKRQIVPD
jgi:UPF0176 protein